MYIKKTTGYVFGDTGAYPRARTADNAIYRVTKTGRIPSCREEGLPFLKKSADITLARNQGFAYYQIFTQPGACDRCGEHSGLVYPVENTQEENLPPFHPNCKCEVRGFPSDNPDDFPLRGEMLLWLEVLYGDDTWEEKARKVREQYHITDFSIDEIATVLQSMDSLPPHVGKWMETFFKKLTRITITVEDLEKFGWQIATKEEADQLTAAFVEYGITYRESIIAFLAIAAAETGYGRQFLEIGSDEYFSGNGYNRNTRGAGYIQVTHDYLHHLFLEYIGDNFSGDDAASYIAEHYPLEVSVWWWSQLYIRNEYPNGVNQLIEEKTDEGGDPLLIFLRAAYFAAASPPDPFHDDMNDAIDGKTTYTLTDTEIIIYSNSEGKDHNYPLPSRWDERLNAYEKAQQIW